MGSSTEKICVGSYSKACETSVSVEEFPNEIDGNQQLNIQLDEKPYNCEFCNKTFSKQCYLRMHQKSHEPKKKYVCNICSKPFKRMAYLVEHLNLHTGEKPFTCDVCSKSFYRKHLLKSHLMSHGVKAPFECHVCQKQFCYKYRLKEHLEKRATKIPFTCHLCQKQFCYEIRLIQHIELHKREKKDINTCFKCAKIFPDIYELKSHSCEVDIKSIPCNFCNRTFTQRSHLKIHLHHKHKDVKVVCF